MTLANIESKGCWRAVAMACGAMLFQGCGPVPEELSADETTAAAEQAAAPGGYAEVYTTKRSYLPGETVELHVSTNAPQYSVEILRDGWTQTSMVQLGNFSGTLYPTPPASQEPWRTGAGWPITTTWVVPTNWTSGSYLVRVRSVGGIAASTTQPFVVRASVPGTRSKVAFLVNFNTRNAYNQWGGKSLYVSNVPGDTHQATSVSFQRPTIGLGACYPGQWAVSSELEADGFAPEYLAESDVHVNPDVLKAYDVVVLACHHEYISRPIYKALSDHHARGGDLAFFSANDIFWQIRYEAAGNTMVGYRNEALAKDPLRGIDDSLVTTNWSGALLNRPPARLQGVAFEPSSDLFEDADYIVQNASHWIFAGTGVHDGDTFGNHMAAWETDYATVDSPLLMDRLLEGVRAVPRAGTTPPVPSVRALAIYYADTPAYGFPLGHGGQVFSSGTTRGWGDSIMATSPGYLAVRQATKNIIQHMVDP